MYRFFVRAILMFFMLTCIFNYIPLSMAGKDSVGVSTVNVSNLKRGASGIVSKPDFIIKETSIRRADTHINIEKYSSLRTEDIIVNCQYGKQRNRIIKLAFDDLRNFCKDSFGC